MALLATDLDGTVIPPERTAERLQEIRLFRDAVAAAGTPLAYVTGRHLSLALQGVAEFGLPQADFLACDVGTSLYTRDRQGYRMLPGYRANMWEGFGGADASAARGVLAPLRAIRRQEESKQAEFKASYYVPWPASPGLVDELEKHLVGAGLSATLVLSQDPLTGDGLLDVLPAGVAKDRALHHLVGHLGLEAEDVVYAGDSGNDRAAFLAGYRAVVVGNAPAPLVRDVRQSAERLGLGALVYFARKKYAGGVLEGCRHHGLFGDPR